MSIELCRNQYWKIRERLGNKKIGDENPNLNRRPHVIQLRYVRLGVNGNSELLYMGVRVCTQCKVAVPAVGITREPDMPIIGVRDITYRMTMDAMCLRSNADGRCHCDVCKDRRNG